MRRRAFKSLLLCISLIPTAGSALSPELGLALGF